MNFYSTRNKNLSASFETALLEGLAPDGGLYFPDTIPKFTKEELDFYKNTSLKKISFLVLSKWLEGEVNLTDLKSIIEKASNFPICISKLENKYLLDLTKGPTLAFKDVAARYLALLIDYFLKKRHEKRIILVATSGDTGGAIAHGFADLANVSVVVLYPKGKVSLLQEEQLARVASNIYPLEIDGYFDDCQKLVKDAFVDIDLKSLNLSSANSINIGRLIPQIIYYVYAYLNLNEQNIRFIVPSGNLGNVTAGLFAKYMGIDAKFVSVTNENDSLVRFYQTNNFTPTETIQTFSNAMDVGNPSNFERLLELFNHDLRVFKENLEVIKVSEEESIHTIKKIYKNDDLELDPHTALAFSAAEKLNNLNIKDVIISTASSLKFAKGIYNKTGILIDDSIEINKLKNKQKRMTPLNKEFTLFKNYLLKTFN